MKVWTIAATGVVLMGGVGLAMAQAPAGPPPGGPGMEGGPGGWRQERMMGGMRYMGPPPSKAAHFRLRKEGAVIDIKCADDEPTKACMDAAVTLLDKVVPK